jgi:hypothetical protein
MTHQRAPLRLSEASWRERVPISGRGIRGRRRGLVLAQELISLEKLAISRGYQQSNPCLSLEKWQHGRSCPQTMIRMTRLSSTRPIASRSQRPAVWPRLNRSGWKRNSASRTAERHGRAENPTRGVFSVMKGTGRASGAIPIPTHPPFPIFFGYCYPKALFHFLGCGVRAVDPRDAGGGMALLFCATAEWLRAGRLRRECVSP